LRTRARNGARQEVVYQVVWINGWGTKVEFWGVQPFEVDRARTRTGMEIWVVQFCEDNGARAEMEQEMERRVVQPFVKATGQEQE